MRIKFEKGMTPERIADAFVKFIYDNKTVIGSVNMYIQVYDEEMKPVKHKNCKDDEFFSCTPTEKAMKEYDEYAAEMRRGKFKAVSNK